MAQDPVFEFQHFGNGSFAIRQDLKLPHIVIARETEAHGDWKTQSVREEFMGLRKDESGTLEKVWTNFYGVWARVLKKDGSTCDVRPQSLDLYECKVDQKISELTVDFYEVFSAQMKNEISGNARRVATAFAVDSVAEEIIVEQVIEDLYTNRFIVRYRKIIPPMIA